MERIWFTMEKKRMSSNIIKKEMLTDCLKIPGDVSNGDFRITMTGNHEVLIENYKGISSFSSEEICIIAKNSVLRIRGCRMYIEYYTMEDMKIKGRIEEVSFL